MGGWFWLGLLWDGGLVGLAGVDESGFGLADVVDEGGGVLDLDTEEGFADVWLFFVDEVEVAFAMDEDFDGGLFCCDDTGDDGLAGWIVL